MSYFGGESSINLLSIPVFQSQGIFVALKVSNKISILSYSSLGTPYQHKGTWCHYTQLSVKM